MKKTIRNLTVTCQSYYRHIRPPAIVMKGAWLKEWGFEKDTPIAVYCENDKLTVVKQDDKKRVRRIKVYGQYCQNKPTTAIILKGKWLKKWGFEWGTSVVVRCEYGKLTITKKGAEEEDS